MTVGTVKLTWSGLLAHLHPDRLRPIVVLGVRARCSAHDAARDDRPGGDPPNRALRSLPRPRLLRSGADTHYYDCCLVLFLLRRMTSCTRSSPGPPTRLAPLDCHPALLRCPRKDHGGGARRYSRRTTNLCQAVAGVALGVRDLKSVLAFVSEDVRAQSAHQGAPAGEPSRLRVRDLLSRSTGVGGRHRLCGVLARGPLGPDPRFPDGTDREARIPGYWLRGHGSTSGPIACRRRARASPRRVRVQREFDIVDSIGFRVGDKRTRACG